MSVKISEIADQEQAGQEQVRPGVTREPAAAPPRTPEEMHEALGKRALDHANLPHKHELVMAKLGLINDQLMDFDLILGDAIAQASAAAPVTIERLQRLLPALDAQLRLARQIASLAHF